MAGILEIVFGGLAVVMVFITGVVWGYSEHLKMEGGKRNETEKCVWG